MKITEERDHFFIHYPGDGVYVQRKRSTRATESPLQSHEVVILAFCEQALRPEGAEQHWLEDELMTVMQIVAPGMAERKPDEITYAMMVTGIRRLMEADTERYEALLERWQKRHPEREPQGDSHG